MNPDVRDNLCHSNNSKVNKKAPIGLYQLLTAVMLVVILAFGGMLLTGCACSSQIASGQSPEQYGTGSETKTSTGDTGSKNNSGNSSSSGSSGNSNPGSSTEGSENSGSSPGNNPSGENKPEDKGQSSKTPATKEPFVGKKYPDAARALNSGSEVSLEIIAYYDSLYGKGKCTIDAEYTEGVSWEYIVTTPDGIVKYQLPLKTCVLSRVS